MNKNPDIDLTPAREAVESRGRRRSSLIPILQDIQKIYGYVPRPAAEMVAEELSIFPAEVYGTLTFYAQFRLEPRGRHIIKVCQGTACHVMGGKDILDYLSGRLGITTGGTTSDGLFSLERVACLGCCGIAPVVVVDEKFFGHVTVQKIESIIESYRQGASGE